MSASKIANAPQGACPHVLVVDDTPLDRLIVSTVIRSSKMRVTAVEGVKEALKFLESENDVDIIVSDYSMPDMTGYDLLMEVTKTPKLQHLPVVIVSSDDIPERIKMCMEEGAKDYIVKPLKKTDLPRILCHISSTK